MGIYVLLLLTQLARKRFELEYGGNSVTQNERDIEERFSEQLKGLSSTAKEQVLMYVEGFTAGYEACKNRTAERESE